MNFLDLFSGIGGIALGLQRAGFKPIALCEIDEPCQRVLKKNFPGVPVYKDVKTLSGLDFEQGSIDVIAGGFPCQDISKAKPKEKRDGIKGARSGLWKEFGRLINEIEPKYIIIENVENLRKEGLGIVLNDLSEMGYMSEWGVFTGRSVGLPHQRERLFVVSYRDGDRLKSDQDRKDSKIQTNKERESPSLESEREGCEFESRSLRQVLSRRAIESGLASMPCQFGFMSGLRRVTYGVPSGMDETRRQERIHQLGNAVIPLIPQIIGEAINEFHDRH